MPRYRNHTSFNQCDTATCTDINGRLRVIHGVEKRCNLILKVMREFWFSEVKYEKANPNDTGSGSMITSYIVSQLKEQPEGKSYTHRDILYALKKLQQMGLVTSEMTYDNMHRMWTLAHLPSQVTIRFKQKKSA